MTCMRVSLIVAILLACGTARADDLEHKRNVAQALSGVGVGVSAGFLTAAFLTDRGGVINVPLFATGLATSAITPSLGELYAGQWLTWGMAVRAGAAGLMILGAYDTETVRCDTGPIGSMCTTLSSSAIPILGIAAVAYVGGAAYDVIDAPDAVDRKSRERFVLAPIVIPRGGGIGLSGSF
jgi:hypothetical protein